MSGRPRTPSTVGRQRFLLRDALLAAAAGVLLWIGAMGFGRTLLAEDESSSDAGQKSRLSPAVERKLDQVTQNDEEILSRFGAIMDELNVVKVRVLRRPQ